MSVIDRNQVERELREIVATNPGRIDPHAHEAAGGGLGCLYFEASGAPSCIVEHWLARHDYTAEQLARYDDDRMTGVDNLRLAIMDDLTQPALELLRTAQSLQDGGERWDDSLRQAIAETAETYGDEL